MSKISFKAGNMLYPLPAVMVSTADRDGRDNIITVAWAGTICTNPPMVSISVRPTRYSYHMLMETREFVINLTTEKLVRAADFCGVKSGRDIDKWKELGLTRAAAQKVSVPCIAESPVNIECRVERVEKLGSHDMFIARVEAVQVDEEYMDRNGGFHLERAEPVVYSHGDYFSLGSMLGKFGYSVQKGLDGKKKNRYHK